MDRDRAVGICAALPGSWPDSPWHPDELVYKIGPAERGKIFCFLGTGAAREGGITVKADPGLVPILHGQYDAVSRPSYLSQQHWIAIKLDGDMPDDEIESLIEASHQLVLAALPKRMQREVLGDAPPC